MPATDLVHEWSHLDDAALMSALGLKGVAAQGRFFPDTYRFAAGTADRHIYELAAQAMTERLRAGVGRAHSGPAGPNSGGRADSRLGR